MKHINITYSDRLEAVNKALWKLCTLNIAVDHIDLNRALPVITVQACGAVRALGGVAFMRRGVGTGTVSRMQAKLENCRIEWEV